MTDKRQLKNLPASIRDRFLSLARRGGEDFQLVLARYALTAEYAEDATKQKQWAGFINRLKLTTGDLTLPVVIAALREFLQPVATATATGTNFNLVWRPAGPWQKEEETHGRK
jgi:hypothetical protein